MMVVTKTPSIGQRRFALSTQLNLEAPLVRHNIPGESHSVVLAPKDLRERLEGSQSFQLGFSLRKERLVKAIKPGHLVFVYIQHPVKRVIGLARVTGSPIFGPEVDYRFLWRLPCEWVIGPKAKGVVLKEMVPALKQRVGDALYGIPKELAERFIKALDILDDLPETRSTKIRSRR